jgi:thiol-disulfide isomerase/thioredoxin
VYVGASWCEPCVAFHDALVAGQLDAELAGVRFLEFDLDRDQARLAADGYQSRYVPLFALPGPDGRASGKQIQGGVKGSGAADNLVRRLQPLLAEARARPGA